MNLKKHLLGIFEISLYMRIGASRFSGEMKEFWWSFIFVLLNFLFIPIVIPYVRESSDMLKSFSLNGLIFLSLIHFIVAYIFIFIFSYLLCYLLKKKNLFIKYITISNWLTLVSIIIIFPFVILMKLGVLNYTEVSPYLIVLCLYLYSLAGYSTKVILQIPWELAAFVAVVNMAANESFYDILGIVSGK